MNYYFILILLIMLVQFCNSDVKSLKRQNVLSRKKRYLSFPEGSVIVLSVSFSNTFIWDYTPPPRPGWNSICEADIGFKLPNNTRLFYGKKPPIKRSSSSSEVHPLHWRERRELFRNIEGFLDVFGVDGHTCVLRALCEAKERLEPGKSLVEDILHVVFTIPDGLGDSFEAEGYSKPASEEFCKSLVQKCPFSLLEYLLYD